MNGESAVQNVVVPIVQAPGGPWTPTTEHAVNEEGAQPRLQFLNPSEPMLLLPAFFQCPYSTVLSSKRYKVTSDETSRSVVGHSCVPIQECTRRPSMMPPKLKMPGLSLVQPKHYPKLHPKIWHANQLQPIPALPWAGLPKESPCPNIQSSWRLKKQSSERYSYDDFSGCWMLCTI